MEDKILMLNNKLAIALERDVTHRRLKALKQYFRNRPFGESELEEINDFYDLWNKLENAGVIEKLNYKELKEAFKAIEADTHIGVFQEFEEMMSYEAEEIAHRKSYDYVIENKEKLLEMIEKFRPLMVEYGGRPFGTVHVYNNAVFGLVSRAGGKLRMKNGRSELFIPENAVQIAEIFYLYQAPFDGLHEEVDTNAKESCINVAKASLPVCAGPEGFKFESTVQLTLRAFTKWSEEPLPVFKKTSGDGTWEEFGTCVVNKEDNKATFHLDNFSSYVLGMTNPVPLNIHILVERLPRGEANRGKDIRVIFLMNDYAFIEELIRRKELHIQSETCTYLDPSHDIVLTRKQWDSEANTIFEEECVVEGRALYNIGYAVAAVTIKCDQSNGACWDILTIGQNGRTVLELPCTKDTDMSTGMDLLGEKNTATILRDDGEGKPTGTPLPQDLVHGSSGKVVSPAAATQVPMRDIRQCRLVFEQSFTCGDYDDIPCIVSLGNKFAVAHPVESNAKQGGRIDIFHSPDRLIHTVTENISGLSDMASTPDGKLAVLCAKGENQCCVNKFDPETGSRVKCSPRFVPGANAVLSFDVSCRGEYYLMGYEDDIRVVRDDGHVVFTQIMWKASWRVSCGGKYVFINHGRHISAYEVKGDRLVHVTRSDVFDLVCGLSATPADEVTLLCKRGCRWHLARSVMRDGKFSEWHYKEIALECEYCSFVSVRGDYIVIRIGDGNTIRVLVYEEKKC